MRRRRRALDSRVPRRARPVHRRQPRSTPHATAPGRRDQRRAPPRRPPSTRPRRDGARAHRLLPRRRQLTAIAADIITAADARAIEGWPANLFVRRDALLLILATSGIRPTAIARTAAGQVHVDDTTDQLHVTTDGETFATDPALRGLGVSPTTVLEEWLALRALQHHVPSPSIAAVALRGDPTPMVPALPDTAPLFTPLDSWGAPPLDTSLHLSAPVVSHLLRAHLTDGAAPHRRIAQRQHAHTEPIPATPIVGPPAPLDPTSWERGLAARRGAQLALAHVDDVLDDLDTRAGALLEDLLRILDDATENGTDP
ncbi:hypothetical protein GCM10009551_054420 [Nocardiopsis tropica]